MHDAIRPLRELQPLRDPVFLAAVRGFADGAGAAAHAVRYLVDQWGAEPVADIDSEPFFDFTVQRPHVRVEDDERVIDWPENRFYVASPPGSERDFVLFTGTEPHLRWRTFTRAVQSVLEEVGSQVSITMGAQPSSVPHTRPSPVVLSASHPEFETLFGLQAPGSRYQGQTGIVGVLNLHLRSLGWRNASLWVMAPHYISIGPNPHVAISLVRLFNRAFDTATPVESLSDEARDFDQQVEEVLAESGDAAAYVRQLEEQYDSNRPALPPGTESAEDNELPPSGELISDLERFLRDQLGDGGR
jgi:predicted ATP-grasp superfamily ATP-dependent carboligase